MEREAAAFGPYAQTVRGWLEADRDAPRTQRHTARRVWQRLVEEHDAGLTESTVRPHVARLKVEVGLVRREVMVPQTHAAGEEAEVDFGQFEASIAGVVSPAPDGPAAGTSPQTRTDRRHEQCGVSDERPADQVDDHRARPQG